MPWYAVDDGFPHHPKLEELEHDYILHALCVAAWTLLGADCAGRHTGGFVSKARFAKVLAFWPAKARDKAAAALVEPLQLWEIAADGWQFHDWDDYQPSAEESKAEKNLKTERQRRWRQNKKAESLARLHVDVYRPSTLASTRVDGQASTPASTGPSTQTSTVDSGARAARDRAGARTLPLPSPHLPSPAPSLASLESDRERAHREAESLVRVEFARRFEQTGQGLWTLHGDPALATLAAWACSMPGETSETVTRLLDAFFADQWAASQHFPVRHLARYPQKYFAPRQAPKTAQQVDPIERLAELNAKHEELKGLIVNADNDGDVAKRTKFELQLEGVRAEMRALKQRGGN
jgi:hypothetical protein